MSVLNWTKKDSELATKEGWDLYYTSGSVDGDLQVQRNGFPGCRQRSRH